MLVDTAAAASDERGSGADAIAAVARNARAVLRTFGLAVMLGGATADAVRLLLRGRLGWPDEGPRWLQRWSRLILWCMGVEISLEGAIPPAAMKPSDGFEAIVCNHVSYLDVLLIATAMPCVMVAKSEVRTWPLIGWLTTRAGSVYVYRGGRRETYPVVNADMARAFRTGVPVVFFPEGTTTDGSEVLPFRRGLFHSVVRDRVPVRPAAVRYEAMTEKTPARGDEEICWCGDAELVPHLYRLLGLRGVRATLRFGERVMGEDRFELAENARSAVVELAQMSGLDHPRNDKGLALQEYVFAGGKWES